MNTGVYVSNILMIIASFFIIRGYLGDLGLFLALISGLICGFLIAQVTEYFTSAERSPVKKIAEAAKTGAAVTIIEGLATGMMSTALVECVPNFSEGRRLDVVEQIVAAVESVKGVVMLDYSSDADHNRSVLTFVGPPKGVEEAAFLAIAKAAELINLDEQEGEHPRIGATDVVPFVPISGVEMKECVEMAKRVGKRVGEELNIPIYL